MSDTDHDLIESDAALGALIDRISGEPSLAIDTEFHRERTYWPKLAVVQIAWRGGIALVDALAADAAPLAALLGPGRTIVMHAASQDLEVFLRTCGTVPERLFDTQVAAGFCGHGTPGLAPLLERELGVKVAKGDRLTDWLRRPLGAEQREYAAADVAHLLDLEASLRAQLEASGRLAWAEEACEEVRQRGLARRDPDEAWWRVKEARNLRGRAAGIAQEVAAWRERRAGEVDVPVRHLLGDLALVSIAQKPPADEAALRKVRGIDERHLRKGFAAEILEAVRTGAALPKERLRLPEAGGVDKDLRPAVTLVSAWIAQLARDEGIDTALLATRADIEALLRNEPDARLGSGWRAEVAGDAVRALVGGDAALAFERGGRLVLEARSRSAFGHQP